MSLKFKNIKLMNELFLHKVCLPSFYPMILTAGLAQKLDVGTEKKSAKKQSCYHVNTETSDTLKISVFI